MLYFSNVSYLPSSKGGRKLGGMLWSEMKNEYDDD